MPLWLIILSLLMLTGGLVLLVRGIRGRAIDNHPICRRCGFDLFGLPVGGAICSECGTDLSLARAIRIGTRQRRPRLAALGVLLILPVTLGLALLAWGSLNNVRWIELQPSWYLLRQVKSNMPVQVNPALAELVRRISAGTLSDAHLIALTDIGLAAQADLNAAWLAQWGDLIEAVRAAGKLSDERWKQYLLNAPQYRLVSRAEVRRGDRLPIRIEKLPARCGSRSNIYTWTEVVMLLSDLVSPEQEPPRGRSGGSISAMGGGATGHDIELDPRLVAAASDGPQTLRLRLKVDLHEQSTYEYALPAIGAKTVDLETTWNLVAADAPTVKVIDDPSHQAAVEKSIRIDDVSVHQEGKHISLSVSLSNPPVSLSYKIFLRSSEREWPIAGICIPANRETSWSTGGDGRDFDADVVDVIFRPDLETALNSIDMVEYWNGEVVIKDVKIKRLN